MIVQGHCKTNLDKFKHEKWPSVFSSNIREGDWVQSESGKCLRVVKITHMVAAIDHELESGHRGYPRPANQQPYIIVELHDLV